MFRKNCPGCGEKISSKYSFCPYCGFGIKEKDIQKNYGLLGENDETGFNNLGAIMPLGFEKIFSSLIKQIDKQFQNLDKEIGKEPNQGIKLPRIKTGGISISISTGKEGNPKIRINNPGGQKFKLIEKPNEVPLKIKHPKISEAVAKKIAKLPRKEAKTTVRRLSDKIIYEISLPGVKNINNIILNHLENSVEIKAFSKDKVYVKLLPVSMPILNYNLKKEKLFIEFKAKD